MNTKRKYLLMALNTLSKSELVDGFAATILSAATELGLPVSADDMIWASKANEVVKTALDKAKHLEAMRN